MSHESVHHYLFADSVKENFVTTADGQLIYAHGKMWNPTSILTLLASGILLAIYMWFYVSPLMRGQGPTSARRRAFVDTEMNAAQDVEKASLIAWIHRSSLGRFNDATGRFGKVEGRSTQQGDYNCLRPPFSRGSSSANTLASGSSTPNGVSLSPPPLAYPAGSNGFAEFELKRPQPTPSPLPPQTDYVSYAPSRCHSFETSSQSLHSPRSQPPSPLQFTVTERF